MHEHRCQEPHGNTILTAGLFKEDATQRQAIREPVLGQMGFGLCSHMMPRGRSPSSLRPTVERRSNAWLMSSYTATVSPGRATSILYSCRESTHFDAK